MKILYVASSSPWPPTVGSRMRSNNILRLLAERHEVSVALLHGGARERSLFEDAALALTKGEVVAAQPPRLGQRWRTATLERYRPILKSQTRGVYAAELEKLIRRENPDLLWFFRLETMWKAECGSYNVPVVCDVDDFEAKAHRRAIRLLSSARRVAATLDYPFFVRAQRATARASDVLLVSNPDDVDEARAMTGRPVRVAPNGYDFSTQPDFEQDRECRIVFFGALSYMPNVDGLHWFVRDIWPTIRATVPEARLDVAGELSSAVEDISRVPGVSLVGFVESIPAFVDRAALLVVPLRMGGGTRIKILEAWALGLPVVSTTVGCEGLDAEDEATVLVADDADGFAQACIRLLRSSDMGVEMATRAFEFARPRYDWEALAPRLEAAISDASRLRRTH